jgi:hypothetical protein
MVGKKKGTEVRDARRRARVKHSPRTSHVYVPWQTQTVVHFFLIIYYILQEQVAREQTADEHTTAEFTVCRTGCH